MLDVRCNVYADCCIRQNLLRVTLQIIELPLPKIKCLDTGHRYACTLALTRRGISVSKATNTRRVHLRSGSVFGIRNLCTRIFYIERKNCRNSTFVSSNTIAFVDTTRQ